MNDKCHQSRDSRLHPITPIIQVKEFQILFKGDGVAILKNGTRIPVSRNSSQRLQALLKPKL